MGMYEVNKKLSNAPGNGFVFNQINKLTIKIYSILSNINIRYYLKFRIPIMHRQFTEKYLKIENIFKLIAMIEEIHFILHVANGIYIIFHNVIWYNHTYPYINTSINIRIFVYLYKNPPVQIKVIGIIIRKLA